MTRLRPLAIAAAIAVAGSALFLLLRGARADASLLFLLGGTLSLTLVIWLLARSGRALLTEPATEEVQLATGRRKKELEHEKYSLVKALKELEFDHEMHKISDPDYESIAATYRARAVRVMRLLDEAGADYKILIERDVAERRGRPPDRLPLPLAGEGRGEGGATTATAAATEDRPPPAGDGRAEGGAATAAGMGAIGRLRCAQCDADNEPDAVFCKKCGGRVTATAAGERQA